MRGGCVDLTAVASKRRVVDARAGFTNKKGLHFAGNFVRNAEHILVAGDGTSSRAQVAKYIL